MKSPNYEKVEISLSSFTRLPALEDYIKSVIIIVITQSCIQHN